MNYLTEIKREKYAKKCFKAGLFWVIAGCLALGFLLGGLEDLIINH
jgi:hypothetical protein